LVEARNHAEQLVHQTEKQLSENASNPKVGAIKGDVEKAIAAVREAIGSDDLQRIKSATQSLMQVTLKIGEAVYQQGTPGEGAAAAGGEAQNKGGGGSQSGENVVDADFEEVKDDKKK